MLPMWHALLLGCLVLTADGTCVEGTSRCDAIDVTSRNAQVGHSLLQVGSVSTLVDSLDDGLIESAGAAAGRSLWQAIAQDGSRAIAGPPPLPIDRPATKSRKHVAVFHNSEINGSDKRGTGRVKELNDADKGNVTEGKRKALKNMLTNTTHRPEDEVPVEEENVENATQQPVGTRQGKGRAKKNRNVSKAMPFVDIHTNHTEDETTVVEVEIATPRIIVSVYLLIYVPVILLWVAYAYNGLKESAYYILLPATLCAAGVGFDLVNQSLAILMNAPFAISSAQAFAMLLMLAAWTLAEELHHGAISGLSRNAIIALATWLIAGFAFASFQLVNHILYNSCSLSERLVFGSMCPACSTLAERLFLPVRLQCRSSLNSKLAQAMMTLGAIVFSIQYNSFSLVGMGSACLYVMCFVPLRLLQRYLLAECPELPVYLLGAVDACCLMLPAAFLSARHTDDTLEAHWSGWLSEASISLMLLLSVFTFTAQHCCTLLCLRATSATATMVFQNIQNFVTVGLGIFCFGDHVLASPLALLALIICLASAAWYALEVDGASSTKNNGGGKGQTCC